MPSISNNYRRLVQATPLESFGASTSFNRCGAALFARFWTTGAAFRWPDLEPVGYNLHVVDMAHGLQLAAMENG